MIKYDIEQKGSLVGKVAMGTFVVDSELSLDSKHPVENRVITQKIYDLESEMEDVSGTVEITDGNPQKEGTVLTLNPNAEEVFVYTAEEIRQLFSNPNLVGNAGFKVWQRGESFTDKADVFFADMWTLTNGKVATINKSGNGFSFVANSGLTFAHRREVLKNQAYTLQVCVNGVIHTVNFASLRTSASDFVQSNESAEVKATLYNYTGTQKFTELRIDIAKTSGVVNWVKLEQGPIATNYVEKDYMEEFLMCERRYQVFKSVYMDIYKRQEATYGMEAITLALDYLTMNRLPTIENLTMRIVEADGDTVYKSKEFTLTLNQPGYFTIYILFGADEKPGESACGMRSSLNLDAEYYFD